MSPEPAGRRRLLLVAGAAAVALAAGAVIALLFYRERADDRPGPDASRSRVDGFGELGLAIRSAADAVVQTCVLVAETVEERRQGLMGREDLAGYDGMLFRYGTEQVLTFHMLNTPMPLSIAFFDGDREFVKALDMEPCLDTTDCELYSSGSPAQFALEVPQGGLDRLGIGPDAGFTIEDECKA